MSKAWLITLVVLGSALLFAVITAFTLIGTYNGQARLKEQYEAKVKANETIYDNMWKKIAQVAQVTDAQKNALKEIFVEHAQARAGEGGQGGSVMSWIQESVPNVDVSVYQNLQNIITGARDEWTANQVALVDISREYNTNLATFPGGFFLRMFGFERIDPLIITSTRSAEAFATGKDDDVSLPIGN